jgi:outer membrane receptor protein involved in Fe transport
VSESLSTDENGETYKLNLSYTPTDRSLYYVQWSQGFRLGEPFGSPPAVCDLDGDGLIDGLGIAAQEQLNPDTLDSYEVGAKLASSDNRVNLRTAVFYNQWSEIPVTRTGDCGFIFLFNAGEAKTSGVELEGSAQLSSQWRLDFSAGYLDGKLTRDAPGLGNDGDRLPGIPKYNAALGLQYDFRYREHDGYLRGDLATVGGFYNNLQEEGEEIGDYTTLNLASGIQLGQFDVQLFINNVTNSHATTWIDQRPEFPSAYRLRPRTAGVSLRYTF